MAFFFFLIIIIRVLVCCFREAYAQSYSDMVNGKK